MATDVAPFISRTVDGPSQGENLNIAIFCPIADGRDYFARVVLTDSAGQIQSDKKCYGIDSVQAIQSAFAYIRSELTEEYSWLGEPAFLGFPRSIQSSFGVEFYRMIEKSSDEELEKFMEQMRKKR